MGNFGQSDNQGCNSPAGCAHCNSSADRNNFIFPKAVGSDLQRIAAALSEQLPSQRRSWGDDHNLPFLKGQAQAAGRRTNAVKRIGVASENFCTTICRKAFRETRISWARLAWPWAR